MLNEEIRDNLVTHDYPHLVDEMVEGLNLLSVKALELSIWYGRVKDYISAKI
jgi:hypothetical protein